MLPQHMNDLAYGDYYTYMTLAPVSVADTSPNGHAARYYALMRKQIYDTQPFDAGLNESVIGT